MNAPWPPVLRDLLRPISEFLDDPGVTDIFINGVHGVFVDRAGEARLLVPARFRSARELDAVVRYLAQNVNVPVDSGHITVELPDGSRLQAISAALAHNGDAPWISIRRHVRAHMDGAMLVRSGAISTSAWAWLTHALVVERKNILFSGASGSGKTSMAEAVLRAVPPEERVLILQDVEEIAAPNPGYHWGSFRPGPSGYDALLASVLRSQADRIALGEVRGQECWSLIEAFSTGHGGGVSTVHASSARGALRRLESLSLQHPHGPSLRAIQARVADAVQIIVQLERTRGDGLPRRYVSEIVEVLGRSDADYEFRQQFLHTDGPERH